MSEVHHNEAVQCLRDIELALRLGNSEGVHRAGFIWAQRRDRILNGRETWADQRFDPTDRRTSGRYFTDAELRARDERIVRAAFEYSLWKSDTVSDELYDAIIAAAEAET